MIDPLRDEIVCLRDGERVRFIEWEAGGEEPRIALCREQDGGTNLYLPDQLDRPERMTAQNDEAPPAEEAEGAR